VVAPRAGGPLDLVQEGITGLLYEPGDGAGLRSHVAGLLAEPVRRRAVGAAARASVRHRSWSALNDQLVEHYRDLSDTRPRLARTG
jgi:phosphatidylinositol alpha 1,6-mannosyltransferase